MKQNNNDIKSILREKSTNELIQLAKINPKLLLIIEDVIIERNDEEDIYEFALNINDINFEKLEDALIKISNPYYILYFAQDIKGANIEKLGQSLIESKEYDILIEFALIDTKNVKKYEEQFVKSNDLNLIYQFLLNVKNADKDKLCKIICNSDNEKYKKIILNDFQEYAIKYLDLNKYNISFYEFKSLIIKDSPLDLINYIEKNKALITNYRNFMGFLLKKAQQEKDFEVLSILEFFDDYIVNPFIYSIEDLEELKNRWNKKYKKVFVKMFE